MSSTITDARYRATLAQPLREEDRETHAIRPGPPDFDPASIAAPRLDYGRLAGAMSATDATGAPSVARRLDEARDAFSGPYRVGDVVISAPPQFRMKGGYQDATFFSPAPDQRSPEAFVRSMTPRGREVFGILARAGVTNPGAVMLGYGKPPALVKATQALIDAGKLPQLPAPATLADRIRKMQWDHGVGVDCVDYSMNALARVRGTSVEALGLTPGTDPFGHDGDVTPRGFSRTTPSGLLAGDIVTLKDPDPRQVGHRVIVREHVTLSGQIDPRRAELALRWGSGAAAFLEGSGPFHLYMVDSSWGAEDGKPFGGYRCDTWVFDEGSRRWMSFSPHTADRGLLVSAAGPAGEIFAGAYRLRP